MREKLAGSEKERYINQLFGSIAPRYDLLNSVISLGRHRAWRRKAVRMSGLARGGTALDVATGTGDFACELALAAGDGGRVVGADFCEPMLRLARAKLKSQTSIGLAAANAERLPFASNTFDCATIGFALRNVASVSSTIAEMSRVIKPGGRVISLEIVRPGSGAFGALWRLYFFRIMPKIAQAFGGKREPYSYLPDSVARFYSREELAGIFEDCGLVDVHFFSLMLGTVCIHIGTKQ